MAGEGAEAGCGQGGGRIGVGPGCPAAPERSHEKVRCSDPPWRWWHQGAMQRELEPREQRKERGLDGPDLPSLLSQGRVCLIWGLPVSPSEQRAAGGCRGSSGCPKAFEALKQGLQPLPLLPANLPSAPPGPGGRRSGMWCNTECGLEAPSPKCSTSWRASPYPRPHRPQCWAVTSAGPWSLLWPRGR